MRPFETRLHFLKNCAVDFSTECHKNVSSLVCDANLGPSWKWCRCKFLGRLVYQFSV